MWVEINLLRLAPARPDLIEGQVHLVDPRSANGCFWDFAANLTSAAKGHILLVNVGHRCEPTDHLFSRVARRCSRRMYRCEDGHRRSCRKFDRRC
jgi:hypothetical protein